MDLFPAWLEDGRLYIWPHTFADASEADLLPLATTQQHGNELEIPQNPDRILAINYGDGWRHPDPSFRFDWVRAQQRFEQFISVVKRERGQA
jgi:hypothetical protein